VDAPSPANEKSRSWATIGHLLGLAIISGLPFSNMLGPLIVYLLRNNTPLRTIHKDAVYWATLIALTIGWGLLWQASGLN
jgi:uncharacterized Tic20 family protein